MVKIVHKILLLLICIFISIEAACPGGIDPCERPVTKQDEDKLINVFNLKRELISDVFQIANMHELVYDSGLAKIAAGEPQNCESRKHGSNYRITFVSVAEANDAFEKTKKSLEFEADSLKMVKNEMDIRNKYIQRNSIEAEILNPLQTRIGCAYFMESCVATFERNDGPKGLKFYKGVCALGPLGTGYANEKSGPPGSQCPGEKKSNGLCKETKNSGVDNVIGWWMIVFFCVSVMSL